MALGGVSPRLLSRLLLFQNCSFQRQTVALKPRQAGFPCGTAVAYRALGLCLEPRATLLLLLQLLSLPPPAAPRCPNPGVPAPLGSWVNLTKRQSSVTLGLSMGNGCKQW